MIQAAADEMREVRLQVTAASMPALKTLKPFPNQAKTPGGGGKAAVRGSREREEKAVDEVEQVMGILLGLNAFL